MRLLLVGCFTEGAIEKMYLRAFYSLNVEVYFFDVNEQYPKTIAQRIFYRVFMRARNNRISYSFLKYLKERCDYFDWILVFKGQQFSCEWLKKLKKTAGRSRWCNFNPDDPYNTLNRGASNEDVLRSIDFYDLYATWSKKILKKLQGSKCKKAIYLPFGFDKRNLKKTIGPANTDIVLFIGTWDKQREQELSRLTDFNLHIYGDRWDQCKKRSGLARSIKGRAIYGDAAAEKVAESAICLNLLRDQNLGAHNMRTFEVPAMGGFLLSTRSVEQQDFFPEGVMADYFSSPEELREKIAYYLQNIDKREIIRKNVIRKIETGADSYQERAKTLLCEFNR